MSPDTWLGAGLIALAAVIYAVLWVGASWVADQIPPDEGKPAPKRTRFDY